MCSIEAKDQIGLEMAWLGDEKVVYTDGIDGSKWECCNGCKKCFHLSCVTGDTEEQVEARGVAISLHFQPMQKRIKGNLSTYS